MKKDKNKEKILFDWHLKDEKWRRWVFIIGTIIVFGILGGCVVYAFVPNESGETLNIVEKTIIIFCLAVFVIGFVIMGIFLETERVCITNKALIICRWLKKRYVPLENIEKIYYDANDRGVYPSKNAKRSMQIGVENGAQYRYKMYQSAGNITVCIHLHNSSKPINLSMRKVNEFRDIIEKALEISNIDIE